jgi:hypothetical protein
MKAFLLLLLFIPTITFGQSSLVIEQTTTIPLGPGANQIGIEKAEGEDWKPLFFSIDGTGNIHIPDFYKGRIAIFSPEGRLIRALAVPQGISPRMNYFSLAAVPGYVTWDGSALYLLDEKGALKWKHPFGYGSIPDRVFVSPSGIFVHLPSFQGVEQGCLVFGYSSPTILGTFGLTTPAGRVPMIAAEGGKAFALKLGDMHSIPGLGVGSFDGPPDAVLLSVTDDLRSAWFEHRKGEDVVTLFSSAGKHVLTEAIVFPAGEEGSGFWTYANSDLSMYKNYFTSDSLQILKYRISE